MQATFAVPKEQEDTFIDDQRGKLEAANARTDIQTEMDLVAFQLRPVQSWTPLLQAQTYAQAATPQALRLCWTHAGK